MIDRERGLKLLGSGLGPVDVAKAIGCDPSLVSQWLAEDSFRSQVLALRMESLQLQTQRDKAIDGIEDTLIEKLRDSVQWLLKPKDILAAFAILNAAKRRGAATGGDLNLTMNVVAITMPAAAKRVYFPETNSQGEVVSVDGEVTTTMPLTDLMRSRTAKMLSAPQENQDACSPNEESGNRTGEETSKATA
jgi:hypothetical protein